VPYTRGAEISRPARKIIEEAENLARAGVREITLLGQNVNAYHGDGEDGAVWSLARLLRRLAQIEGIVRLRFTTSHPNDMGEDLIDAFADLPSLMPFLHLPVQSGSDAILHAMNRRHSADDYIRLIEKIRRARPDVALSSDFIVGFPGESEADVQATLDLIAEIGFASNFSFKYSPRPGTPGAERAEQVDEPVKTERLHRLQALVEGQRHEFNASQVGRFIPVLWERSGRREGQVSGKSPYMQTVHIDAPTSLIGSVTTAEITHCGTNSLFGRATDGAFAPRKAD
jgi:tRNA-2-methylthio-N6-dimethylallyladenosine synthase